MKKPTEEELKLLKGKPYFYMTKEELDALKDDKEWQENKNSYCTLKYSQSMEYAENFWARYPNCPGWVWAKEPFDLVLDKKKALEILHGKRRAIVLPKNEETRKFLENKEAIEFLRWAKENDVKEAIYAQEQMYFRTILFDKLHVHDKENTWFLDVDVWVTNQLTCVPEDVGSFRRRTKCHDLDAITRRLDQQGVDLNKRPYYYFFELRDNVKDSIIATNLK